MTCSTWETRSWPTSRARRGSGCRPCGSTAPAFVGAPPIPRRTPKRETSTSCPRSSSGSRGTVDPALVLAAARRKSGKRHRRPTRLSNDSSLSASEGAEGVPSVTVGERILVHLSGFLRHADSYECPVEMTQDGIANALLLSRAHVALELKRLKSTGKVQERMAHVANARSRRKVYELTPAGQEISRRMREHARARTIELSAPEGRRTVLGGEAIDALRHAGLREAEAVQRVLVSEVVEMPRPEPAKPAAVPSRTFFGRADERRYLEEWLASGSRAVAVVIGVAGIGKSALLARALAEERRPKLLRRVYAHDDAHGLLSSFADFLAHQNRRRMKAAITRPAYDPIEVVAVLREDLSGCVLAIDDLHACPAADALLRAVFEHPPDAKILVASRTQPTFFEPPDVARGRVVELRLEGLDDDSAAELLASRGASLKPADVPRVVAATGGHPLALELFAASGLDAGAVETERYVLDTVLEDLADPSENLRRRFAVLRRRERSPMGRCGPRGPY